MKNYSKQKRERLMAEFKNSGMTGIDFCKQKGIKKTTFYSWRQSEKKSRQSQFVKVNPHLDAILSPKLTIEKDGWKITLPNDQTSIRTIFNALGLIHVY